MWADSFCVLSFSPAFPPLPFVCMLFALCYILSEIIEGIAVMTAVAEKIMETALELSPIDRAELIERLYLSFDASTERPVDKAWGAEVESRIEAYDAGKIEASSAEKVFDRIARR